MVVCAGPNKAKMEDRLFRDLMRWVRLTGSYRMVRHEAMVLDVYPGLSVSVCRFEGFGEDIRDLLKATDRISDLVAQGGAGRKAGGHAHGRDGVGHGWGSKATEHSEEMAIARVCLGRETWPSSDLLPS